MPNSKINEIPVTDIIFFLICKKKKKNVDILLPRPLIKLLHGRQKLGIRQVDEGQITTIKRL